MIKVVNRHTYKGKRGEYISKYIGRGTIFGNPYSHVVCFGSYTVKTREEAIEKYRGYMRELWVKSPELREEMGKLAMQHLNGKKIVLICSCKPKSCHGDVLKEAIETLVGDILSDAVLESKESE